MSFLSFLKKAGVDILKGATIAAEVAGVIQPIVDMTGGKAAPVVDKAVSELKQFESLAVTIEAAANAMFGPDAKVGAQKLAALVPFVSSIIQESEVMVGKHVADDVLFQKAMTEFAQASVDLANSLHPATSTATPVPVSH